MEGKKSTYRGYTEARARAYAKYIQNHKEVKVRMSPDDYDEIKAFADSCGESVNGFITRIIREAIAKK